MGAGAAAGFVARAARLPFTAPSAGCSPGPEVPLASHSRQPRPRRCWQGASPGGRRRGEERSEPAPRQADTHPSEPASRGDGRLGQGTGRTSAAPRPPSAPAEHDISPRRHRPPLGATERRRLSPHGFHRSSSFARVPALPCQGCCQG